MFIYVVRAADGNFVGILVSKLYISAGLDTLIVQTLTTLQSHSMFKDIIESVISKSKLSELVDYHSLFKAIGRMYCRIASANRE